MKSRTIAFCVFYGLVLLSVAQAMYYYPLLPARMASHFGPGGQADGWMEKPEFMVAYAFFVVLIVMIFFGMGMLMHKLPVSMLNLPNKDYWLEPERRAETFRRISVDMMWFGNATLLLMVGCMEIVFRANLQPVWNPDSAFIIILAFYVIVMLIWTGIFVFHFRRPKQTE